MNKLQDLIMKHIGSDNEELRPAVAQAISEWNKEIPLKGLVVLYVDARGFSRKDVVTLVQGCIADLPVDRINKAQYDVIVIPSDSRKLQLLRFDDDKDAVQEITDLLKNQH